ncbi:hypothetical protein ACHWQZ_G012267 [Mnemiopsis leidyi]
MTLVPKSESDTEKMSDCAQPEVRKRKRADYSKLSPDERNLKRKLKNRMSAQQARDRKKLYVSELEERVAQLEKENSNLRRICSMQLRGTDDSAAITGPLPWALLLLQLLARKTYVAILKSAAPKSAARTAAPAGHATNRVIVEGTTRTVEQVTKPLMIAPKPISTSSSAPDEKTLVVPKPTPVSAPQAAPKPAPQSVPAPDVPKVEDIRPSITPEDSVIDWDDIFRECATPDLFSDIPLSMGSPDSGLGSDFIGSEPDIFSSNDAHMDSFSTDSADLNTLSPLSDSIDWDSDKFLSDSLTF